MPLDLLFNNFPFPIPDIDRPWDDDTEDSEENKF